jgi:hypothetical protein
MNLTLQDMINNTIKTAKFKLNMHREKGIKSELSVFQVAELLDSIKRSEQQKESNPSSIFHSISLN